MVGSPFFTNFAQTNATMNIVHVHLHQPHNGENDYYFGSLAAIHEYLPADVVGISANVLRCKFAKSGGMIETPQGFIKRREILIKPKSKS